jgi:hypothetical protein
LIGWAFLPDRMAAASPGHPRPAERASVPAVVPALSSPATIRDAVRACRSPSSQTLAAGRVASWGDVAGPEIALWALYPSRRLLSARVSAFPEHLRETVPTGGREEPAAFLDA